MTNTGLSATPRSPGWSVTGVWLAVTRRHCWGFPCFDDFLFHACQRHYPGGIVGCCRYLVQRRRPSLKTRQVGFRNSLFEACSAFTHVPACMVAKSPKVTRYTRVLQRICYLLRRPDCFRPSDRLARWDSHPLKIVNFSRHTPFTACPINQNRHRRVSGTARRAARGGRFSAEVVFTSAS